MPAFSRAAVLAIAVCRSTLFMTIGCRVLALSRKSRLGSVPSQSDHLDSSKLLPLIHSPSGVSSARDFSMAIASSEFFAPLRFTVSKVWQYAKK